MVVDAGFAGLFAAKALRRVSGFAGWLVWLAVHLFSLTGFRNRVAVLSSCAIAFLSNGRPQRTITTQQMFAR